MCTSTFFDAVLISKATDRQTAARKSALFVEVDWARVWRTLSHQGEISLSRNCDEDISLGKPPGKDKIKGHINGMENCGV